MQSRNTYFRCLHTLTFFKLSTQRVFTKILELNINLRSSSNLKSSKSCKTYLLFDDSLKKVYTIWCRVNQIYSLIYIIYEWFLLFRYVKQGSFDVSSMKVTWLHKIAIQNFLSRNKDWKITVCAYQVYCYLLINKNQLGLYWKIIYRMD